MTLKSGAMIAATVATMLTGFAGCGEEEETSSTTEGLRCEGGNSCKAMSECKASGKNECQGMNACAGMGYITTETQAACDAARAAVKAPDGTST